MEAAAIWLAAIWLGWKIEEAAETIADAMREDDGE